MKMNRYKRLQKVNGLLEKSAEMQFSRVNARLQSEQNKVDELIRYKHEYTSRLHSLSQSRDKLGTELLKTYIQFMETIEKSISTQQKEVQRIEHLQQHARQNYMMQMTKTSQVNKCIGKSMDKLTRKQRESARDSLLETFLNNRLLTSK